MNRDLHTVIEARRMRDGHIAYRCVSPELGWGEAQELWDELDSARTSGMHENYFMVRSANDPRWAFLVRPVVTGGWSGDTKATKAWGRSQGYEGRTGGWIYSLSGRNLGQGWDSLVGYAKRTKSIRSLIRANGKLAWYNAKPEFQFEEDQVLTSGPNGIKVDA
jgi:hypothetical protein